MHSDLLGRGESRPPNTHSGDLIGASLWLQNPDIQIIRLIIQKGYHKYLNENLLTRIDNNTFAGLSGLESLFDVFFRWREVSILVTSNIKVVLELVLATSLDLGLMGGR
uniref:Uncharacterized protein n=1 Tax=Magallana gigas TaxID=29159 RepID=K1QI63_MAGGI